MPTDDIFAELDKQFGNTSQSEEPKGIQEKSLFEEKSAIEEGLDAAFGFLPKPVKSFLGGANRSLARYANELDFYSDKLGNALGLPETKDSIFEYIRDNAEYFANKYDKEGMSPGLMRSVVSGTGAGLVDMAGLTATKGLGSANLAAHGAASGYMEGGLPGAALGAAQGRLMHGTISAIGGMAPQYQLPTAFGVGYATGQGGVEERTAEGIVFAGLAANRGNLGGIKDAIRNIPEDVRAVMAKYTKPSKSKTLEGIVSARKKESPAITRKAESERQVEEVEPENDYRSPQEVPPVAKAIQEIYEAKNPGAETVTPADAERLIENERKAKIESIVAEETAIESKADKTETVPEPTKEPTVIEAVKAYAASTTGDTATTTVRPKDAIQRALDNYRSNALNIKNRMRGAYEFVIDNMKRKGDLANLRTDIINRHINRIRNEAVEWVKANVPKELQGRFTRGIVNAKTMKQINALFNRAENATDNYHKRLGFEQAKKEWAKIAKSKNIAPEDKQAALWYYKALMHQRKMGYSIDTQTVWDFVDRLKNAGQAGREKIKGEIEKEKEEIDALFNEFNQEGGKQKLDLPEKETPETFFERLTGKYRQAIQTAKNFGKSITHWDVFFDQLDGGKGQFGGHLKPGGSVHKFFKRGMDVWSQVHRAMTDKMLDPAHQLIEKYGAYTPEEQERVMVYLTARQLGKSKSDIKGILEESGWNWERVEQIRLTDKEKAWVDMATQYGKDKAPALKRYAREVNRDDFVEVENHHPIIFDREAYANSNVEDRLSRNFNARTGKVEQGTLQTRTGGKHKLSFDLLQNWERYVTDVEYLLAAGSHIKQMRQVVLDPRFAEVFGTANQQKALDYVDTQARRGGASNSTTTPIIDWMRKNTTIAQLLLRPTTILKQFASIPAAGVYIGEDVINGAKEYLTNDAARKAVMEMPEVKHRIAERELDPAETGKVSQVAGKGIKWSDSHTAGMNAVGAYINYCKRNGIEVDWNNMNRGGIEFAQWVVKMAQGSTLPKDIPSAVSRGDIPGFGGNKSLARALLHFQTFALANWTTFRHVALQAGIRDKNPRDAAAKLFWLGTATAASAGITYGAGQVLDMATGRDEKDKNKKDFIDRMTQELVQSVPVGGNMYSAMQYGGLSMPILDTMNKAIKGVGLPLKASGIMDSKSGDLSPRNVIEGVEGLASVAGVPGAGYMSQVAKSIVKGKKKKSNYPGLDDFLDDYKVKGEKR